MTNNRNTINSTYRNSYVVSGILFVILFALCMTLFNFVSYEGSGTVLTIVRTVSYISAFICAFITCVRCAESNKLRNPDIFIPPRDTLYYLKRMGFFVLMIVLMSLAASLVGMVVTAFFGWLFVGIESAFFSEFLLKLPLFILYLSFGYKMLVRFGFMDSQRKIFNPYFKMLTFIVSFMVMLPSLIYSNFFYISTFNDGMMDVQTVLSPNVGVYIVESDGYKYLNENFGVVNVILIAVTVLLTFAIQAAVFAYAYRRGKQIFIKEHIRETDEYEMNENI